MKNGLIFSFVVFFILVNAAFFEDIVAGFLIVSDIFWAIFNFDLMCIILGVLFAVLFAVFLVYFFRHREKGDLVMPVEFKSPDDMTPLELGFLVDGVVDDEDLSSLLVYWASKRYIEISKDKKNQKLTKLVEKLPENARDYEKNLFSAIFRADKEIYVNAIAERLGNSSVVINAVKSVESSVGEKYFSTKTLLHRQVFICLFALLYFVSVMYFRLEYFVDVVPIIEIFAIASTSLFVIFADLFLKYFDYRHKNNATKGRVVTFVLLAVLVGVMAGLCCWFFWTDLYQLIFLVCALGLMFFVCLLAKNLQIYKKEGQTKLGQVLGFKQFLEVAEKDRIKMLVKENPNVFYDVLPYAFVLGVSDKWIENLNVIKVEIPNTIDERNVENILIWSHFVSNSHLNLMRAARVANIVTTSASAGGKISLGSNGGSGRSKGGSNFGGFRRR